MGRPQLSDAQVADFRRLASAVSLQLFAEKGYEGFTLRALAKAMGCSHATPYRYFESKAELFAVVRADAFRRFAAFLRHALRPVDDPERRLRALARAYFRFATEHSAAFTIAFRMGQPETEAYPFVDEAARDAWSVLFGAVRDAVEARVLAGDPKVVAHTMWAGVHGVSTLTLAHELSMSLAPDAMLDAMSDALLAAHRPPPEMEIDDE